MLLRNLYLIFILLILPIKIAMATELTDPRLTLQQGLQNLLALHQQITPATDRNALMTKLEQQVLPYFDFALMANWVAAPYRNQLSPSQMQNLTRYLQALFLTALARNLGEGGTEYSFMLHEPLFNLQRPNEVMVKVQIYRGENKLTLVDFRLYHDQQRWKIFDVSAYGTSAMLYYRNLLEQQIQQHGLEQLLGE
jgi:ABC-type transporter MlaC component